MEDGETEMKLNKLRKLHEATNKTVEHFEKENKRLNTAIQILIQEKTQWLKSKEQQDKIIFQTITNSNQKNSEVNEEMQWLRDENRLLKEEINRLKGG